jgi:hypothetical protein
MKRGKNQELIIRRSGAKRGQVWVETVIYTLIALAMIGMVLAFVKPKIEEFQDRTIIRQSIEMLKKIDSIINEIRIGGSGNQRVVDLKIEKGTLKIDGENDDLVFEIEGKSEYSEPGETYQEGNVLVTTEDRGEVKIVVLKIDYENYNITYQNKEGTKSITQASTDYKLIISNKGKSGNKTRIDMEIE